VRLLDWCLPAFTKFLDVVKGRVQQLNKQNERMTGRWALNEAELKESQEDSNQLKEYIQSLEVSTKRPISVYAQHLIDAMFSKTDLQNFKKVNNDLRKELRLSQHAVQAAERLKLELEGAQSENANLQAQMAELQRGNTELKRQTEKWKKLETKNDQEARTRMDLEVVKGELEERVQELESKDKESSRELKKLRTQIKSLEVRPNLH
jgi:chromosome segregation ATPase